MFHGHLLETDVTNCLLGHEIWNSGSSPWTFTFVPGTLCSSKIRTGFWDLHAQS